MIDMEQARDRALDFRWGVPAELLWAAGIPDTPDKLYDQARRSILAAACIAADEAPFGDAWWISYSRRKAFYEGQQRYQGLPYTYERVTAAIAEGVALGLLEEERAKPGAHLAKDPRQSRFRATRDLLSSFQDSPFEYRRRPSPIMLRDADGQPIPLPTTQAVQRLRREMEALEPYFGSIRLTLGQGDGWEYAKRTLRARSDRTGGWANVTPEPCLHPVRIFSRASMSKGGRLYAWYHQLPSARRAECLINGEIIVEPDFSALHPRLLHALKGVEMRHDPYEVAECPRPHAKRALNTLINARSRMQAAASLFHHPSFPKDRAYVQRVMRAVEKRNPVIRSFLGSDAGIDLMAIDSRMALDVVKGCAKLSIPVLPVHDSFVAPASQGSRVEGIMDEILARTVNKLSYSKSSTNR
ncbi:hypothetical protein [Methylorubrum salsuginis]|uniref:DNA-directed RNA polymerase n=1 Tax=Methylorubrum salsuginis TaxID=414703 RepID=A0A1I4N2A5_9HYPH|nr:hypothetical protein [Methylorubrum salsuginis]SFM09515.1 hypothetical protein SAMN04488125_1523 [Methylorubrum salsuginis]